VIYVFDDADLIFEYTIKEAVEDGILVYLPKLIPGLSPRPFNYATTNLLRCGYIVDSEANIPALRGLISQACEIMRRNGKADWFYSGKIELPMIKSKKLCPCTSLRLYPNIFSA
jgi:hypothetical protein